MLLLPLLLVMLLLLSFLCCRRRRRPPTPPPHTPTHRLPRCLRRRHRHRRRRRRRRRPRPRPRPVFLSLPHPSRARGSADGGPCTSAALHRRWFLLFGGVVALVPRARGSAAGAICWRPRLVFCIFLFPGRSHRFNKGCRVFFRCNIVPVAPISHFNMVVVSDPKKKSGHFQTLGCQLSVAAIISCLRR